MTFKKFIIPMQFFADAGGAGTEGTTATETTGKTNEHAGAENGGGDPKSAEGTEPQHDNIIRLKKDIRHVKWRIFF